MSDGCFHENGMFRPALVRLIRFEADKPIFSTTNDPLLISRITRSGPGVSPAIDTSVLEQIFRHNVLKMLRSKGKITQDMIVLLVEDPVFSGDKWRPTGFNVYCGPRILPWQKKSMASGS